MPPLVQAIVLGLVFVLLFAGVVVGIVLDNNRLPMEKRITFRGIVGEFYQGCHDIVGDFFGARALGNMDNGIITSQDVANRARKAGINV